MLRPPPISAISASAQPQEEYLLEDFDPQIIPDADFSKFILTGRWDDEPENDVAFKSPKEPKELKELKELEELEELKELELSEKKKKVEELQEQLNTIKTLTPKLFKDLSDEIEKLITQIEKEANTVIAITKHRITISEIITKIEDPEIYRSFEQSKNKDPEIYKSSLKDPIKAIITQVLADDPKIGEEFKKLFTADPDSITKIITPIVKENAIKKIIDEIKSDTSEESQTEENKFDSFGKIIAKILEKDSLISKYYKKDSYSIAGIIDQLQSEKTDEDSINKITTRILDENAKAFQAITKDPLGQIFIAHKKETSKKILSEIEKAVSPISKVGGEVVKTKIHSHISQEIVEKNILEIDSNKLSEIKIVEKEILDAYRYRSEIESRPTIKTSLFSRLFPVAIPQNREKIETVVSDDSTIKGDVVFVKLDNLTQAEEKLAKTEKKGEDLDVKKLLIYAELIAKIPQEYSESISPTHQKIIYLKKQEKGHKKTLGFLKGLIQEEEERIAEKKRIAEEITQIEKTVEEIAKEIAEAKKLYLAEQERIDAEKRVEISVKEIRRAFEGQINEAKKLTLQEQKIQITRTLNSNSLIQAKTDIDKKVREILSSEYVDEKLVSVSGESTMEQLLVEAIIVDEARKKLTPDEIKEIESDLEPKSTDSNSLEIDKKTLNLLIIKKALEKILTSEQKEMGLDEEINIDVTAINTLQNKLNFFKLDNQLNLDALALLESKEQSKALEERLAEINIELEKQSKALNDHLAELNELEKKLSTPELESPSIKDANIDSSLMEKQLFASDEERVEKDPCQLQISQHFAENYSEFIDSTSIEENQFLQLQNTEQTRGELGSSAQQSDVPPPTTLDRSQASIPSLNIGEVEKNKSQTIPRKQEEKKQFWQNFISTRLREKPSNSNQNSPRDNEDDSNQDQFDTRPQSSSPTLESESLDGSSTFRSTSSYSKEEDEIEKRRIGLYTILLANLENQITTVSEDEEEIDAITAENNIEFVMTHIATLTLDLASSISKDENKQTGENLQSKPSDPQTTQNSSTEDPIIYSGIGIRIKLENENGEYFLRITEVFENSDLKDEDVNKKITHIKCGDELKSIGEIHRECGNDDEKFYNKISLIFRDEKQRTLSLKIEDEEKTVEKKFFIPKDRKGLNVKDNSQVTKIADKLRASRQISSQLTPREELTITT